MWMTMLNRAIQGPRGRGVGGPAGDLGPAVGWAVGGAAVVAALGLALYVLYVLAVSVGEWWAGTPPQAMTGLASAPLYRNLAALFLAGFLAIFVAGEIGMGTR